MEATPPSDCLRKVSAKIEWPEEVYISYLHHVLGVVYGPYHNLLVSRLALFSEPVDTSATNDE